MRSAQRRAVSPVETGEVRQTALAFTIGALLMVAAGVVAVILSVVAEQQGVEDIATLSAEDAEPEPGGLHA